VALQNQPIFKAPSVPKPKMGKKNVSSSIFSRVSSAITPNRVSSAITPKLNVSKFSFSSLFQKLKTAEELRVEKTNVEGQRDIAISLNETNRILVEIQKQLALDFANRIAERKQNLISAKKKIRKTKLASKEEFVERGKEQKNFNILDSKILAPTKGIFDKIMDFLAFIGTGIIVNTAWKWLSDPENRKKLEDAFKFLTDNWKLIVGILGGAYLAKKLYGLYRIINSIRKLINFLRGPRSKPGLPGTKTPSDCNPILNCLKSPAVVAAMANAVAPRVAGILSGKIKPSPVPGSGPAFNLDDFIKGLGSLLLLPLLLDPTAQPAGAAERPGELPASKLPASEQGKPKPAVDFSDSEAIAKTLQELESGGVPLQAVKPKLQLKSSHGTPIPPGLAFVLAELKEEYARTKKPASRLTPQGFLAVRATSPFNATPEITFNPKLTPESNKAAVQQATALFTVANLPSTLSPLLGSRGLSTRDTQSRAISRVSKQGVFEGFDPTKINTNFTPRTVATPSSSSTTSAGPTKTKQVRLTAEQMQEMINRSGFAVPATTISKRSTKIDPGNYPSSKDMLNAAARGESQGLLSPEKSQRMLLQLEKEKLEKLFNMAAVGRSMGGLIGGVPSMVDTIPAMLAKGEFVVNAFATKMAKPLLYAINESGGKIFNDLVDAIKQFKEFILRDDKLVRRRETSTKDLSKHIAEMRERARLKKIEENPDGGNGGIRPNKKSAPKSIQTYNRGRGGGSRGNTPQSSGAPSVTTINLTKPGVTVPVKKQPEPPKQSSVSSSPTITIEPIDISNEYNKTFFSLYEIV